MQELGELKSVPEIMIVSMAKNFGMQPIQVDSSHQAASLLTNNSKFFSLLLAKGLKGDFVPILAFMRDMCEHSERLVELALKDATGGSIVRLLQGFKSALVSKSADVARQACNLYSNLSHQLIDKASLDLAYGWFVNPSTNGASTAVMCAHRHIDLVENVTTMIIDIVRNHFESFFDESLPQLLRNDFQYIRFINTIFGSLLSREMPRQVVERTGILGKWCTMAFNVFNAQTPVGMKTDCISFLANCWVALPDYFEGIPNLAASLVDTLSDFAMKQGQVFHSICTSRMFELLERFSAERRKWAPELYKRLIALLLSADKDPTARDRLVQGFIHMFLNSDVPSSVLLDSYLLHFQSKLSIDIDPNVFDIDFLKFLVRDTRLNSKFKLYFFDIFCRLVLNSLYGTAVFAEIVDLSAQLVGVEDKQVYVEKFWEATIRFYTTTYKNRKIATGQLNELQQMQMHKRALICNYFIALIPKLEDEASKEKIRELAIKNYIDINAFYERDRKKQAMKGQVQGLKEIIMLFGDFDEQVDQYMKQNNMYYGDEILPDGTRSRSPGKMDFSSIVSAEETELAKKAEDKLANGSVLTKDERSALTRYQNAQRIIANRLKQKKALESVDSEQHASKSDLYAKLLEKGIKDDPKGVEKLAEFKQKLSAAKEKQLEHLASQKLKELEVKNSVDALLQQRRVELGVESSFTVEEIPETLIFPFNQYEKNKSKFETSAIAVEIDLLDLNTLEKLDAEAVQLKMNEYRKLWRNIFNLYANSLKGFEKGADFNKIKDQLSRISRMEFWKFIKEYGLTNFITQEEVAVLFKQINIKYRKNHSDLSFLDYHGHKEMMLQTIVLMFSRPPIDLSHLPPVFALDKFIEMVKKKYHDEGHKTDFFEDANKFSVMGDPQVIDYLNAQLQIDPNFPVPHKYEKIIEKKVFYEPKVCTVLKLTTSYEVCYSIVADMLKAIAGVDLLEMIPRVEELPKVRPKTFKELELEEHVRPKDAIHKSRGDFKIKTPKLPENKRVLKIDHANIEPSVAIKVALSEVPLKDVDLAKECGIVLEELLRAVEKGQERYRLLDKYTPLPTENPIVLEKERQYKDQLELERLREEKRLKRVEKNKKEIIEKRGDLDWQARYKKKMKDIEEAIRKKNNVNEQNLKIPKNHYKQQKQQVKKHRAKLRELEKSLAQSQRSKYEKRKSELKKQTHDFSIKKVRELQQQWRAQERDFKLRSAASVRASDPDLQKQVHKTEALEFMNQMETIKQKIRSQKEHRQKLVDGLKKDELYAAFLKRHEVQLGTLYDTYNKQENFGLKTDDQPDLLCFDGFKMFCQDFKVVPFILSAVELAKLFNRFSLENKVLRQDNEPGLDSHQFVELLMTVSLRKPTILAAEFQTKCLTLKWFEQREKVRKDWLERERQIKLKKTDIEKRLNRGVESLEVKDAEKPREQVDPKDNETAEKREEEKSRQAYEKRKAEEKDWAEKIREKDLRYFEGLLAYLDLPDIKKGIVAEIIRQQSAKKLPARVIKKGTYGRHVEKLGELKQAGLVPDTSEQLHKIYKRLGLEKQKQTGLAAETSDALNVSLVMSELEKKQNQDNEDSFVTRDHRSQSAKIKRAKTAKAVNKQPSKQPIAGS